MPGFCNSGPLLICEHLGCPCADHEFTLMSSLPRIFRITRLLNYLFVPRQIVSVRLNGTEAGMVNIAKVSKFGIRDRLVSLVAHGPRPRDVA